MKNIFVTGISGTGKTTLARALEKRGIRSISIDEVPGLCAWINRLDGQKIDYEAVLNQEFINSHMWVCDKERLEKMLDEGKGAIVFGHAENQTDFLQLFDKVILLQCAPETFLKRIMERKDNDFGKDETAQKYLLDTYKNFEESMLKKGAIPVSTERSLEEVIETLVIHSEESQKC